MLKKECSQPNFKTYKDLSADKELLKRFKSGEQLPLFMTELPKVSPAISQGLPKLKELLLAQGVKIDNFDELYTAAINILKFVANKEKRAIVVNPEEYTNE